MHPPLVRRRILQGLGVLLAWAWLALGLGWPQVAQAQGVELSTLSTSRTKACWRSNSPRG